MSSQAVRGPEEAVATGKVRIKIPPNQPHRIKELLDSNLRPSRVEIAELLDERRGINFTAD